MNWNRPSIIWGVLALCATLILGTMGWMTHRALAGEQERADSRAHADYMERLRLALTRMDAVGTRLVLAENQRPPLDYSAFSAPGDIYATSAGEAAPGAPLQPSPLLLQAPQFTQLHFEQMPGGPVDSPQVPTGRLRDLALNRGLSAEQIDASAEQLARITQMLAGRSVSDLESESRQIETIVKESLEIAEDEIFSQAQDKSSDYAVDLTTREQSSRKMKLDWDVERATLQNVAAARGGVTGSRSEAEQLSSLTPLSPQWIGGELLLLRTLRGTRSEKVQGIWMDIDSLGDAFREELTRDLYGAQIAPLSAGESSQFSLVSLPWKLVPAVIPEISLPWDTALRKTLLLGWTAALIALAALCALLRGVLTLSERRAAFVSSVTHELRTPLTTFRLYSEMLSDGMVQDEKAKKEYLQTMLSESERLNHLVENVLAYSQIERGTARSNYETIPISLLVERLSPVLKRRVDQEGMKLTAKVGEECGEILTDVTAVDQILFNLVDNACKYGQAESGGGEITLRAFQTDRASIFQVSDGGKGIARGEQDRLFRAFHKSASDAAHSKPGVGLGLALCRRLAKALGGRLEILDHDEPGATFQLTIPLVAQ